MGVLGLAPFINKICPEVVRTLPDRLRALAGKTVVIDGTLITQRLHFAPMPHRFRHVLGWYRIVKELKDCNVRAICVFDGKERTSAKESEMERRRNIRKITAARGALEVERLGRLRRLASLLPMWHTLPGAERQRVSDILRTLVGASEQPSGNMQLLSSRISRDLYKTFRAPNPYDVLESDSSTSHESADENWESDAEEVFLGRNEQPVGSTSRAGEESHSISIHGPESITSPFDDTHLAGYEQSGVDGPYMVDIASDDIALGDEAIELVEEVPTEALIVPPFVDDSLVLPPEKLPSALASLYLQYRQSIPKLTALPEPTLREPHLTTADLDATSEEAVAVKSEEQEERVMSKTQHQLTLDEGSFWNCLSQSDLGDSEANVAQVTAAALAQKSSIISESYRRRTHPPTTETYMQSKEILQAMGVPCIDSTGPYEAEALASSLVLHGYADYVASEDTDVLVYEAPLIRNIASRNGPLVVISGTDVRKCLQLDRARYIDFALLLGTDFSQRIKNVGPARALRFIRTHGSIERVIECESQYPPRIPPEMYLAQVTLARSVFTTLPPAPDPELLQPRAYEEENVIRVLSRYGLHRYVAHDWIHGAALSGNFFDDDPAAS